MADEQEASFPIEARAKIVVLRQHHMRAVSQIIDLESALQVAQEHINILAAQVADMARRLSLAQT